MSQDPEVPNPSSFDPSQAPPSKLEGFLLDKASLLQELQQHHHDPKLYKLNLKVGIENLENPSTEQFIQHRLEQLFKRDGPKYT